MEIPKVITSIREAEEIQKELNDNQVLFIEFDYSEVEQEVDNENEEWNWYCYRKA